MKPLYLLFVVASVLFSAAQALMHISDFVTNTELGTITTPVTMRKILNALVRANPDLPQGLKEQNKKRGAITYVKEFTDDRAVISVQPGPVFEGAVAVTYNRPKTSSGRGDNGNSWGSKFNLASQTNLNRNLGRLPNNSDDAIRAAFMALNPNLPSELRNLLQVGRSRNRTTLYFADNSRYEGNVVVFYST